MDDDKTNIHQAKTTLKKPSPKRAAKSADKARLNTSSTGISPEPTKNPDEKTVLSRSRQKPVDQQKTQLKAPKKREETLITSPPSFSQDKTLVKTPKIASDDDTLPSEGNFSASAPYSGSSYSDSYVAATSAEGEIGIGSVLRQRFVLESELGTGGMGAVYRALDLRKQEAGDNKPHIAIKLLRGAFKQHQQAFVTLQREAKKTQELAHPNIVTAYDFDRVGDVVYLTMEELKGHALKDVIQGKTDVELDYKAKIRIITEIARGLAYAHSKGIVHSDLKPANLFLTEQGTIKVLDFGIARAINEELYQDNFDAGELGALTYPYASLEMIQHDSPDPSDDIYALGIIACELLGDGHPYGRKDAQHALKNKLPVKLPGFRNPLLRRWIRKSVALRRADRIASAQEFIKSLHFANSGPRRAGGLALASALALIGNFIYLQNIEIEAVPFESLAKEQQQQFFTFIDEGNTAIKFADLDGAVFYFNQAFAIHESHENIVEAKSRVLSIVQKNIDNAPDETRKALFVKQLQSLQEHPAFADGIPPN